MWKFFIRFIIGICLRVNVYKNVKKIVVVCDRLGGCVKFVEGDWVFLGI